MCCGRSTLEILDRVRAQKMRRWSKLYMGNDGSMGELWENYGRSIDLCICLRKNGEQPIPMVYHHHYLLMAIGGKLHSQTHSTGERSFCSVGLDFLGGCKVDV
jgi:hypothetical protein